MKILIWLMVSFSMSITVASEMETVSSLLESFSSDPDTFKERIGTNITISGVIAETGMSIYIANPV